MRLPAAAVSRAAARQQGVLTTSQLLTLGADPSWITREVAAGHWQRLHHGVVLTHSGPVPRQARAWAALLYAGRDARLSHTTAAELHGFRTARAGPVHVTIPGDRRVRPTAGVVMHHRRVLPPAGGRPRRTWRGDTVVDLVAAARSDDEAVGWVCDAVRAGTNRLEVLDALARRTRVRSAALLTELLEEVADGVESPLERRYRRDVERRHGLPAAALQVVEHVAGGWIRADAVYLGLGVRVELDGALAHPGGRTDADTWRDNAVVLERGDLTLRYRWRHVALASCATAAQVAAALGSRGWSARPRRCGAGCAVR